MWILRRVGDCWECWDIFFCQWSLKNNMQKISIIVIFLSLLMTKNHGSWHQFHSSHPIRPNEPWIKPNFDRNLETQFWTHGWIWWFWSHPVNELRRRDWVGGLNQSVLRFLFVFCLRTLDPFTSGTLPKLTVTLPWKWWERNTIRLPFGGVWAYFQVRTVSFKEGTPLIVFPGFVASFTCFTLLYLMVCLFVCRYA